MSIPISDLKGVWLQAYDLAMEHHWTDSINRMDLPHNRSFFYVSLKPGLIKKIKEVMPALEIKRHGRILMCYMLHRNDLIYMKEYFQEKYFSKLDNGKLDANLFWNVLQGFDTPMLDCGSEFENKIFKNDICMYYTQVNLVSRNNNRVPMICAFVISHMDPADLVADKLKGYSNVTPIFGHSLYSHQVIFKTT